MFKKTRKQIRITIEALKAAFKLGVATVDKLTLAVETNSAKVEALAVEQSELRHKFAVLVEHTGFLAKEKRRELERSGHHVE